MTAEQLFAPEPFEQMPGQLALEELESPISWRVTYARGNGKGSGAMFVTCKSAESARRAVEACSWQFAPDYIEVVAVEAEF